MKDKIIEAVLNGDDEYLDLIVSVIELSYEAQHVLRMRGYGWTGLDILKTCELVPINEDLNN